MTETTIKVYPEQPNYSNTPAGSGKLSINGKYFLTPPGLLKVAEIVLGILCIALASPAYFGETHFFLFVACTSFILTIIWIFIYLLGLKEALRIPVNWILLELFNTALWGGLYILAFILQLILAASFPSEFDLLLSFRRSYIAAGVFGMFNAGVYCVAAFLLFLEWKRNRSSSTN